MSWTKPPSIGRPTSPACFLLLISMTWRSGRPLVSLMPLASVVSSGIIRPVTVTSPRGGSGTFGKLVRSPSERIQPRLTRIALPSSRTSGVTTK